MLTTRLPSMLALSVLVFACSSSSSSGGGSTEDGGSSGGSSSGASGSSSGGSSGTSSSSGASSGSEGGGGDGGGGLTCSAYCAKVAANCTGTHAQYPSSDSCAAVCPDFMPGTAADMSGDTLGCRLYHATLAASDPTTHCEHAGPTGGAHSGSVTGPCGNGCEAFCAIAAVACTGANQQFTSTSVCMTACNGFAALKSPPYSTADSASNDFGCRMYHLSLAATGGANATMHCPHIVAASPVCTN